MADYDKYIVVNENGNVVGEGVRPQRVIIEQRKPGNGLGTAGFVLSLLAFLFSFLCIIPYVGFIVLLITAVLWLLGFIFSIIGMCRPRRGLAIAGFVLSLFAAVIAAVATSVMFEIARGINF